VHEPRTIKPEVGVDAFEFGMTRPQLWALTSSTIHSFLPTEARERVDHLLMHGIHVEYADGAACFFMVFARMPDRALAPILVLDEDVSAFTRADVETLLELHGLARVDEVEQIIVPSLGLGFGFREAGEDGGEVVEFVSLGPVASHERAPR